MCTVKTGTRFYCLSIKRLKRASVNTETQNKHSESVECKRLVSRSRMAIGKNPVSTGRFSVVYRFIRALEDIFKVFVCFQ